MELIIDRGQEEAPTKSYLSAYDESCYLCPGNKRAQGDRNPQYDKVFVFVNDYSAVKESQADYEPDEKSSLSARFLQAQPVKGRCYVLTFSAKHNLTLADLSPQEIVPIINVWADIYALHVSPKSSLCTAYPATSVPENSPARQISNPMEQYRYMQIFENKGATMGCSNPHPHGQIWTTSSLPEEPSKELSQMMKYCKDHNGSHMLEDYATLELEKKERIVFENDTFLVLCPWWAVWPFETMITSKRHKRALVDLTQEEKEDLAGAMAELTRRYDNLFQTNFPYSMGIHQAPLDGSDEEMACSYLHLHFYPPLLRSATVKKFLVGYELLAEPQRDITPEQAAARLRSCGGELYRKQL
ncbi:galactose-1-phosphate uridylyltransferase [Arthroderma uncinatum]|uniref:galactose-1-phosphate uridylyltransferase n=1 Tax=Arthroderma uncinatum TaxID=74035 RepID=UPI00144AAB23|nr:galactose-1-phosphate uridylyltransferase [Arthroderma uncinatum]KAF3482854.1 galactose-1-phosphate uridylyltransferase [Arthroderma uncinatum]